MRSARRCKATSTCDQAAFTDSFWVTSWLRTLTYLPPNMRPASSRTTRTMRRTFMSFSLPLFLEAVYGVNHDGDLFKIRVEQARGFQFARLDALFAQIQQFVERQRVDAEIFISLLDDLALLAMRGHSVQQQGVAEQDAERGKRIRQQPAQYVRIP